MNVWKMNLKDNRDYCDIPKNLQCSKFDFCKQHNIVGIGWAGYEDKQKNSLPEKDSGYEKAKNSISSFDIGDLVWVKNPETKEYYLCKIKSPIMHTDDEEFNKNDISMFCECEYIYIGDSNNLPERIQKENLISISTISKANEQLLEATISFYNTIELKLQTKANNVSFICNSILKHKWIYIFLFLAILISLTLVIISVNNKRSHQEKEITTLLANQTFVSKIKTEEKRYFYILKFNNDNEYAYGWVNLKENSDEIEKIEYLCEFDRYYEVDVSFFGKKQVIHQSKTELIFEKNKIVSIDDFYYPISNSTLNMLTAYETKLMQKEAANKKEQEEVTLIKSYIPNKEEFYERVLQTFAEVKDWQLFGNTDTLYMDPHNSKNFCNLSDRPILIFSNGYDGNSKICFSRTEKGLMLIGNGGNRLTDERYEQLIKLAFGNAPDELKICDLETFKKLADIEEKAYPSEHSVEYKGITYEWKVGYKNGEQNSYTFSITY